MQSEPQQTNHAGGSFGQGPVGEGDYRVRQGDSIDRIAYREGFFWETLWNLQENAELKKHRKNPDALLPGDMVFIPEKRQANESAATDQTHRFRRKGVPIEIDIVFYLDDKPIPDTHYQLDIDGRLFSGTTEDGRIKHPIPPDARRGSLTLDDGNTAVEYQLNIGHIDSIEEISGIQSRLNNLGYPCGKADGEMNERTIAAIKHFQQINELPESGELTAETVDKIEAEYGS